MWEGTPCVQRETFMDLWYHELEPQDAARVLEHLNHCTHCFLEWTEIQHFFETAAVLRESVEMPSPNVLHALLEEVTRSVPFRRRLAKHLSSWLALPIPAYRVVLTVALLAVGVFLATPSSNRTNKMTTEILQLESSSNAEKEVPVPSTEGAANSEASHDDYYVMAQ